MNRISTKLVMILGLAVAVGLGTAVSPFASSSPDGLERVAMDKAFIDKGELHSLQRVAPVPGYAFPWVKNQRVATGLAGLVGTIGVFALGYSLAWMVRRRGARVDMRGDAEAPT